MAAPQPFGNPLGLLASALGFGSQASVLDGEKKCPPCPHARSDQAEDRTFGKKKKPKKPKKCECDAPIDGYGVPLSPVSVLYTYEPLGGSHSYVPPTGPVQVPVSYDPAVPAPAYAEPQPAYAALQPYTPPAQIQYQAPAPSYQAPAPAYQAQTPTYQAPTPAYQAPAPAYDPPTPNYNAPPYAAPHQYQPFEEAPPQPLSPRDIGRPVQ